MVISVSEIFLLRHMSDLPIFSVNKSLSDTSTLTLPTIGANFDNDNEPRRFGSKT